MLRPLPELGVMLTPGGVVGAMLEGMPGRVSMQEVEVGVERARRPRTRVVVLMPEPTTGPGL